MLEVEFNGKEDFRIPSGRPAEMIIILKNRSGNKEKVGISVESDLHMKNMDLEWRLEIEGATKEKIDLLVTKDENHVVTLESEIPKNRNKDIFVRITSPKASEIGDYAVFRIGISNNVSWSKEVKIMIESAIIAVKTSIGQEVRVARDIAMRAKIKSIKEIYAVLAPYNLKGYVFVETSRPDKILSLIRGIKGAKGVVRGEMKMEDIRHYLTPAPAVTRMAKGDIVELVEGPFKGEHARVIDIDEAKNEITVELFEAMVPIPITVKAEAVRVIERGDENGTGS